MGREAIHAIGLGKAYRIGARRETNRTLRDALVQAVMRPFERARHPGAATHRSEELWALRDLDLEVGRGEVLGVIGRNGAGKSTLLKVFSRITEPTVGRVEVTGRVGSLLEVGTGFHPELTGRENIQLNGAILGMTRAEIKRRFDRIVEFGEIGRFLDTPVKRYSSGMYVRLAFAVAAHLDPDILIVDEVLSVGDAGFQKKCVGTMSEVAGSGRTVVFVSHNMQAIRSLCRTAIQLDGGRIVRRGDAKSVVAQYLTEQAETKGSISWPDGRGPGDQEARLASIEVLDENGRLVNLVNADRPFVVRITVDLARVDSALCVGFDLATDEGSIVFRTYQTDGNPDEWPRLRVGRNTLDCAIPAGLLNDGRYLVLPRVGIHCVRWIVREEAAVAFEVQRSVGTSPYSVTERPGTIAPILRWRGPEDDIGARPTDLSIDKA